LRSPGGKKRGKEKNTMLTHCPSLCSGVHRAPTEATAAGRTGMSALPKLGWIQVRILPDWWL
jgi:hypothetical protein